MTLKFQKPRYKIYTRFLEDVKNDFKLEKFNNKKWSKLKKILRFNSRTWETVRLNKKKFNKYNHLLKYQYGYLKKLKFFFLSSNKVFTKPNSIIPLKKISSIFSFFEQKRYKKRFKFNLLNKQKLCYFYKIQDYKLKNLVSLYNTEKKNFFTLNFSFIKILERRLDNILYKSGFVKNISQSRQLINHKKVLVNQVIQSKIDYSVKTLDIIELVNVPTNYIQKNLINNYKKRKKFIKKKAFKKKRFKNKIKIKNKIFLKNYNNLFFYLKKFKKINLKFFKKKNKLIKPKRNKFFLLFFLPHLEVNYRTFCISYIGDVDITKSSKYNLELSSVYNYYLRK